MQSKAATVDQYLAELPDDRRAALQTMRKTILANLPPGYEEGMQYGMIGYYVPHCIYPDGYHCDPKQPLPFVGLASQKNYMSIYLGSIYMAGDDAAWFRKAWGKSGKKLDLGKACVRFTKIENVPLEVIGEAIRRAPLKKFIAYYESAIKGAPRRGKGAGAPVAAAKKKAASKKSLAARKPTAAKRGPVRAQSKKKPKP